MYKKMTFPTAPPKTTGQKAFDWAVTLILVGFIAYGLQKLFELLLRPFQYLLMKPEDFQELYVEKAQEKKANRDKRMELLKQDVSDPMVQYRLRYIEHPERYVNNSENKDYLIWYKEWREGKVDDPELRWAPPVYVEKEVNPEFISYVEFQAKLLYDCGNRRPFLRVIRKFYPELTPKFPDILKDIEELKTLVEEKSLHNELYSELKSAGLTDGLIEEVVKMEPSKIQGAVQYFKKCMEFGYSDEVSMTIMEIGLEPGSEFAETTNKWMTKALIPASAMIALGKGEIEASDLEEIAQVIKDRCELFGMSFMYSTREGNEDCFMEECINEIINQAKKRTRSKKIDNEIGEKVW
jgi:hypothetical protein